jgi:hypothetical protein
MLAPDYLTPIEASKSGYQALTIPYMLPREQDMLDNVLEDMERGQIDHALVDISKDLVEVWRRPSSHNPALN